MITDLTQYKNRSYDYFAFQNVKPTGETKLVMELFSPETSGQIATGVQKLTQRWLLEFLTESGSMPGLPNRGTNFMRDVRLGRLRNYSAVWTAFSFSSYTAAVNLRAEEDDTWNAEDRYKSAELVSLTVLPGYASLKIAITSAAGETRETILPIPTLPQTIVDG